MTTDAERARDARGFSDHLADHLFSAAIRISWTK